MFLLFVIVILKHNSVHLFNANASMPVKLRSLVSILM